MIGVLALQGAFAKHMEMLKGLSVSALEVRQPEDLDMCSGLIIPGGESTAITIQMAFAGMDAEIAKFMSCKPTFGTCAGLILMAGKCLDIRVKRNGYGRQIESVCSPLEIKLPSKRKIKFPGIFIRAPRILSVGEGVKVLAEMGGEPVFVQQGCCLGASFHPELTKDTAIHEYFCKIVEAKRRLINCDKSKI